MSDDFQFEDEPNQRAWPIGGLGANMRKAVMALAVAMITVEHAGSSYSAEFDGTWVAYGQQLPGTRYCGDWSVSLVVAPGQLSAFVKVGRGSQPLENLMLRPDGSFTGSARGGFPGTNGQPLPAFTVSGKLSGDTITASLETLTVVTCPTRNGQGKRASR
jgi:hypothetical protein